jgi:hypothetical protein
MTDPTPMDELGRYQDALVAISEAFTAINQMPHGGHEPGKGPLAEAQQHLAAARRALDAWREGA